MLAGSADRGGEGAFGERHQLREAGITSTRVAGTRRVITLRRDDLDARYPGLLAAVITSGIV